MLNTVFVESYIPPLYRYMDDKYIDLFFKLGILRISSFEHFKKHKDEARLDIKEGYADLNGHCINSNMKVEIGFGVGSDCFTFCTSLVKSKNIAEIFQVKNCFCIKQPQQFLICIADALIKENYRVNRILNGYCHYTKRKTVDNAILQEDIDAIGINTKDNTLDFNKIFELGAKIAGNDIYFLKSDNYQEQQEYRFIWQVQGEIPQYIDLYVPNAVQYCEKVTLE